MTYLMMLYLVDVSRAHFLRLLWMLLKKFMPVCCIQQSEGDAEVQNSAALTYAQVNNLQVFSVAYQ